MRNTGHHLNITVNDLSISYNDEGPEDAQAIIFLHGFPLNKSLWDAQLKALKDSYRVIACDIRGHGSTGMGEEDFSIDLFVSDLLGFMDAIGIHSAILCGLSMGGYIALNAAENHPEHFNALILCDTQCIADTPEAKAKRMITMETIRAGGMEKYTEDSLKNLFAAESFSTKQAEIDAVRNMIRNTAEASVIRTLQALAERRETCSRLPELNMPVLIFVGENDQMTKPEVARQMQEKIRNSVLHIIEHAGHLSNLENPEVFNDLVLKFTSQDKAAYANNNRIEMHQNAEHDINEKILKITLSIREHYPELSKYLNEMPVTVPDKTNPEVNLSRLTDYYKSLQVLRDKYKLEHPESK